MCWSEKPEMQDGYPLAPLELKMDLNEIVKKAVSMCPENVKEYREGNTALLGMFVGDAMLLSRGKADPKHLLELIREELKTAVVVKKKKVGNWPALITWYETKVMISYNGFAGAVIFGYDYKKVEKDFIQAMNLAESIRTLRMFSKTHRF